MPRRQLPTPSAEIRDRILRIYKFEHVRLCCREGQMPSPSFSSHTGSLGAALCLPPANARRRAWCISPWPDAIYRACRELQRKFFDPPNLSGGKYE
jgi:hypothetical protein